MYIIITGKLKTCIDEEAWKNVHFVLAGGYDPRIESSVTYLAKLKEIAKEEDVEAKVTFILSPKDHIKVRLLHRCCALLYTPSEEHFGIVPLEVRLLVYLYEICVKLKMFCIL